ncbi:hypothetical protein GCM10020229_07160 [Kitasatospora albolonga]
MTFRRAALAGLPLLALYSVGTGLNGADNACCGSCSPPLATCCCSSPRARTGSPAGAGVFHGTSQDGSGTISHSGHRSACSPWPALVVIPLIVPQTGLGLFGTATERRAASARDRAAASPR